MANNHHYFGLVSSGTRSDLKTLTWRGEVRLVFNNSFHLMGWVCNLFNRYSEKQRPVK